MFTEPIFNFSARKNVMDIGLAPLGLQGYSPKHADVVLSFYHHIEGRKVISFVWNSFGRRKKNIKKWYSIAGENSTTIIYLSNEVDRRKNQIDSRNLLYKLDPGAYNKRLVHDHPKTFFHLRNRIEDIVDFHKAHGVGELRIVLGLEDNFTSAAAQKVVDVINSVDPSIKTIRNPSGSAPSQGPAGADFLEFHDMRHAIPNNQFGVTVDGYEVCTEFCGRNLDQMLTDEQLKSAVHKFSGGDYFLLWHSVLNMLEEDSVEAKEPSKRKSDIKLGCIHGLAKLQRKLSQI
jgi:hypothetical protein